MKLIKESILTSSYQEVYEFDGSLVNDYRQTLSGSNKDYSDETPDDYEFIVEMQDEFYDWLYYQENNNNPKVKYSEDEQVIDGYFNQQTIEKD